MYAPTNTLNTLLVPLIGITSVTNRADINVGRLKENDNELRARRYASVNIIGAGTNGAMTANIRNIEGVIGAFALYLNSVVGVVQAFQKLTFLNALAPTQSEPPFLAAQGIVLMIVVGLTAVALKRFHPGSAPSTSAQM